MQRYCVRLNTLDEAASTGVNIYQRQCMTARRWRLHGIRFASIETAVAARM